MRYFPSLLSTCLATLLFAPSVQAAEAFPSTGEMATEGELEVWNDNVLYSKGDTTIEFGPDIVATATKVLAHGFDAKLPVYELKDATINIHGTLLSGDSLLVIPALGEVMSMGAITITAEGLHKSGPRTVYTCSGGYIHRDGVNTGPTSACANSMVEVYCDGSLIRTRLKYGCMH